MNWRSLSGPELMCLVFPSSFGGPHELGFEKRVVENAIRPDGGHERREGEALLYCASLAETEILTTMSAYALDEPLGPVAVRQAPS